MHRDDFNSEFDRRLVAYRERQNYATPTERVLAAVLVAQAVAIIVLMSVR
jgi:hypothetical protein